MIVVVAGAEQPTAAERLLDFAECGCVACLRERQDFPEYYRAAVKLAKYTKCQPLTVLRAIVEAWTKEEVFAALN